MQFIWQKPTHKQQMLQSLFIIGGSFMLARAVFFGIAAPFFIPLWIYISVYYPKFKKRALVGGMIGALSLSLGQLLILFLQLFVFRVINKVGGNQWIVVKCALTVFIGQFIWQMLYYQQFPSRSLLLSISIEVILTCFMALFIQTIMLQEQIKKRMKYDAKLLISLWIVLAIMLTGTISIQIGYLNASIFLLHFMICTLSLYFPFHIVIGATTVIASLYNVATLSFTAMLAISILTAIIVSFAQSFPKLIIACLSIIPSGFFYLFDQTLPLDAVYFVSISLAAAAFLFLPRKQERLISPTIIATKQIPPPTYTAIKLFEFLQKILQEQIDSMDKAKQALPKPFDACTNCMKIEQCWQVKNAKMPDFTEEWLFNNRLNYSFELLKVEEKISRVCIRKDRLLHDLRSKSVEQITLAQVQQSKKTFALQLGDMMKHLTNYLNQTENEVNAIPAEERLTLQLRANGITTEEITYTFQADQVVIVAISIKSQLVRQSLIDQIMYQLENQLKGLYQFKNVVNDEGKETVVLQFELVPRFQLTHKIFSRSKKQHVVSGDAYRVLELPSAVTAFLLSDGMGSSYQARKESEELLFWMEQLLTLSLSPEAAMQTVHYLYALKQQRDIYATLDVALINAMNGKLYLWKAGGVSSYIIRHNEIINVRNFSPPIGSSNKFFITIDEQQLKSNDMIVLISDGLFSDRSSWDEQEGYFQQLLRNLLTKNVSVQALLYELMDKYTHQYPLTDDCTIIMIEVKHVQANWKTVPEHFVHV